MLSKIQQTMCILGLCVAVVSSAGCVALVVGAAAGTGGVVWARGALKQNFQKPLYKVHEATVRALKKLDLPVIINNKDNLTAKVESEFSDGKRIKINIESVNRKSTDMTIRIGTFGDERRSREILNEIAKNL